MDRSKVKRNYLLQTKLIQTMKSTSSYMKNTLILFFLLLLGCQESAITADKNLPQTQQAVPEVSIANKNIIATCEDLFRKIVRSSDLEAMKRFNNILIRIENKSNQKVIIELYTTTISDASGTERKVERTVGWLYFYPTSKRLFDVTNDPDNPVELMFKKELLKENDFNTICEIGPKIIPPEAIKLSKESCVEIKDEMLSGEECLITSSDFKLVYQQIITEKELDDSELLQKHLPMKNQTVKINQKGLIEIQYHITEEKIIIEMFYNGGVTSIELLKKNQKILRRIIYSYD